MNTGYYIISDLKIFHLLFYGIILWNKHGRHKGVHIILRQILVYK
jgi:hypothetical protein